MTKRINLIYRTLGKSPSIHQCKLAFIRKGDLENPPKAKSGEEKLI